MDREAEIDEIRGVLVRKDEERRRLLAAYVKEAISLEEFQAAAAELDEARSGLEDRLRRLETIEEPEPRELMDEELVGDSESPCRWSFE